MTLDSQGRRWLACFNNSNAIRELNLRLRDTQKLCLDPLIRDLFGYGSLSMGSAWGGELGTKPFKILAASPDVKATHNIRLEFQAFQHTMTSMLSFVDDEQTSSWIV